MIDSTNDLYFSDYESYKAVGTTSGSANNALKNLSAKEIVIPEFYQGYKVIAIRNRAFQKTSIESCFISRYIKVIFRYVFWNCFSLKYITFDVNSELETINELVADSEVISINLPLSLKTIESSIIMNNAQLSCVSYLGSIDLTNINFIDGTVGSLVAHAMPGYSYSFGSYHPVLDGQKCPEKTFSIQLKKRSRGCTCHKHTNRIPFIAVIIFIIVS